MDSITAQLDQHPISHLELGLDRPFETTLLFPYHSPGEIFQADQTLRAGLLLASALLMRPMGLRLSPPVQGTSWS